MRESATIPIGYFARQALRHLDELRVEHGRLDFPVPVGEGGTLRVELNNTDSSVLPSGMRLGDNDSRILAVAMHLAQDGQEVTVVSKDLPMRVKAASLGISAEEYLAEQAVDSGWTGIAQLDVSGDDLSDLYESDVAVSDDVRGLPVNTGLIIHSERGSALGRVTGDGGYRLVRGDREVFGLHGRSAEQRIAIDLLLDPEVGHRDPHLGEQRPSDFLLWQSAHSEFYFVEALGPDLREVDFLRAIRAFASRDPRFGS